MPPKKKTWAYEDFTIVRATWIEFGRKINDWRVHQPDGRMFDAWEGSARYKEQLPKIEEAVRRSREMATYV